MTVALAFTLFMAIHRVPAHLISCQKFYNKLVGVKDIYCGAWKQFSASLRSPSRIPSASRQRSDNIRLLHKDYELYSYSWQPHRIQISLSLSLSCKIRVFQSFCRLWAHPKLYNLLHQSHALCCSRQVMFLALGNTTSCSLWFLCLAAGVCPDLSAAALLMTQSLCWELWRSLLSADWSSGEQTLCDRLCSPLLPNLLDHDGCLHTCSTYHILRYTISCAMQAAINGRSMTKLADRSKNSAMPVRRDKSRQTV